MHKLFYILLTIVSFGLFVVGILFLVSAGINMLGSINGDKFEMIKTLILPVVYAVAFFYTAKKLFFYSFYEVIRK